MWLNLILILLTASVCLAGPSGIVRPCDLDNYKCMGDNLAINSKCNSKVRSKIPAEYRVESFYFDTPSFNASYIDKNLYIRNLNKCKVAEFFFNTKSDKVVVGIECKGLQMESDRSFIQHRTYQEDSYYGYHIKATYPILRFTVNLPSVSRMDLCSASIYSEVVVLPILKIDPKSKSTADNLSRDLSLLHIYERENIHSRGKSLIYKFIDSMICDYGCSLST